MQLVRWIESLPPLNGLEVLMFSIVAVGAGLVVKAAVRRALVASTRRKWLRRMGVGHGS